MNGKGHCNLQKVKANIVEHSNKEIYSMQEVDIVEHTNVNCLVCRFGLVIGGRSWLGVGLCVHVVWFGL